MLTFYIWISEKNGKVHPDDSKNEEEVKPFVLLNPDYTEMGDMPKVSIWSKEYEVCERSLYLFHIKGQFREKVLRLVTQASFDHFILFLILLNSVGLMVYDHRAPDASGFNGFQNEILDIVLTIFFTLEFMLKVVAWGLIMDRHSYLRDAWNWLDFIVVISALLSLLPGGSEGLAFLRVFRALRPLRSLNAVPQMKVLVNTVIGSVPRLGNVTAVGAFLFMVFGVIGVTLMNGVFDHQCRTTPAPVLTFVNGTSGPQCWSWPWNGDERLCGGAYNCEATNGYCGAKEEDPNPDVRPTFPGGKQGFPWCVGSEPGKQNPEDDLIHFDHIGGAFLIVFQCMTLEGWTDIMYKVQDAYSFWISTIYFTLVITLTSFFLLNVALAVVDEARAEFDEEEAEEGEAENDDDGKGPRSSILDEMALLDDLDDDDQDVVDMDEEPWLDCGLVHICRKVANTDLFMNVIMLFIIANVVTMMTESFPPNVSEQNIINILEKIFLGVFCVEMAILVSALGPKKYSSNPVTAFDGAIVLVAVMQEIFGASGPFTALRTFRLFRVLNKLANRWPSFKVLLKAMVLTAISLNYWLILFALVLFIFTLMCLTFFAKEFHFNDPDTFDSVLNAGEFWCPGTEGLTMHYRQDCIPRANFDTFLMGFVTIFQIMTGENWNTVMYAAMLSKGWAFAFVFAFLILFGQTLFLSIFLSMLMSKFDKVQDNLNEKLEKEREKETEKAKQKLKAIGSKDEAESGDDSGTDRPQTPDSKDVGPLTKLYKEVLRFYKSITERDGWPNGYAWFLLSKTNPIRVACNWVLNVEVKIGEDRIKIFDNFILLCILISSVGMAYDSPMRDPKESLTIAVREADQVFSIVFIIEMCLKLLALGLIWGPDAYLKSGWNCLDGVVVVVSIVNMASATSSGFLKTLRILRAFRPLRVISRNENLKVVVQTIFASLPHLLTLVIVALIFLLIFALLFLQYMNGKFMACLMGDATVPLMRELGEAFPLPMCLPAVINATTMAGFCKSGDSCPGELRGNWQESNSSWVGGNNSCTQQRPLAFQRATGDTPICVARCWSEHASTAGVPPPPEWLCPKELTIPEQLPSVCPGSDVWATDRSNLTADEVIGIDFVQAMSRHMVLPCGGSQLVDGYIDTNVSAVSCASIFCPEPASEDLQKTCESNCKQEPSFCNVACDGLKEASLECQACRKECEAMCRCRDYCEPMVRDAALCHEQGARWMPTISQSFDNIWNAMLTLFEISTTEGWVDVMYAATDKTDHYVQPKRENEAVAWTLVMIFYMFFSAMFIINLSVGVIVDQFMMMKTSNQTVMLTETQKAWVNSMTSLYSRSYIVNLTNLHEKPTHQRRLYNIVNSSYFDNAIMAAIVINTLFMALKIYPNPYPAWDDALQAANYVFAGIFTIECILKLIALRANYFRDRWNLFDFTCVVATAVGIIVSEIFKVNISSVTSVIRIFRIARLFKLLRFLKGLNKIFMALLLSLPKLLNVLLILLLLLTLYSILGVSIFSTAKLGDTLNDHGNFKDFIWAFITLFRCSTGEAWNEIMHDLAKRDVDFYKAGDWCTPDSLFDNENKFDVLQSKCLIQSPNVCVQTLMGMNVLPYIYWVSYTLLITFIVMNLVIAVILEGYEDGKETPASEVVDICIKLWLQYDPDHRLSLPLGKTLSFINEALKEIEHGESHEIFKTSNKGDESDADALSQVAQIPMRYVAALDVQVEENGRVHFVSACKQVMRFVCMGDDLSAMEDLDHVQSKLDKKEAAKLQRLADRSDLRIIKSTKSPQGAEGGLKRGRTSLKDEVAAVKLQTAVKMTFLAKQAKADIAKRKAEEARQQALQEGGADAELPGAPSSSAAAPSSAAVHPAPAARGPDEEAPPTGPLLRDPLEQDPMPGAT